METFKLHKGFVIALVLILIAVISFYFYFDPSNYELFPKCPFYSATGIYCPGCGSQRAIHHILHGNILAGFRYNLLIFLLLIVLIYEGVIYLFNAIYKKKLKNIFHYSISTNIILILIILFWVLRNISTYPFTLLAP